MRIDRSNYEVWMTDWLDNRLTGKEIDELMTFLDANPELLEEFENLENFCFIPGNKRYPYRYNLLKTPGDIPQSQFDLYCAAYSEKDLDEQQMTELAEMLGSRPERRRDLEMTLRAKLKPPEIIYTNKKLLKRRSVTPFHLILSVIGTAAAIILFVLLARLPGYKSDRETVAIETTDTIYIIRPGVYYGKVTETIRKSGLAHVIMKDTVMKAAEDVPVFVKAVEIPEKLAFNNLQPVIKEKTEDTLIPVTISELPEITYDERTWAGKFIASTVRKKILKEETSGDEPLKGYEIAEAGISGLNRLFGWEMALDRNNDEHGETKSVYFSSRLIKFNAPVKNN